MLKHKYLGCPYKEKCEVEYRNEFYCGTAKHLKCIEFQAIRDKENKNKKDRSTFISRSTH